MLRYVIAGMIGVGVLAFFLMLGMSLTAPAGDPRALARGSMASFVPLKTAKPVPDTAFMRDGGGEVTLADFRGKVVLVNLWATWCAPCKTEMPTLNALQQELGGDAFEVVAISLDRSGPDVARQFLEQQNLGHLTVYNDPSGRMLGNFPVPGLPFTIVVDRQSRVVGRLVGPAEWDTPEAKALLNHFIEG